MNYSLDVRFAGFEDGEEKEENHDSGHDGANDNSGGENRESDSEDDEDPEREPPNFRYTTGSNFSNFTLSDAPHDLRVKFHLI